MMSTKEFQTILAHLQRGHAADLIREVDGQAYVRRFVPEERLIILGGGHIARPLCAMGALLDFSVTVVDDRPDFANRERFPQAAEVICDSFAHAIDVLDIRPTDYVCIITRGHRWDGQCLRQILSGVMPSYLGMIGSRRRVTAQLQLLAEEGFEADLLRRVHTPIGLKIGAITPAEIAVSICAQLVQHRRSLPTREKVPGLLEQTNTDPALLEYLSGNNEPKALLLVLSSTGSTPVKSGAVMAVDALGRGYGTIGGGLGEAEAMAQARRMVGTGERRVIEVDMSNDVAADEGMVCGGTMRVLLEDASEPEA